MSRLFGVRTLRKTLLSRIRDRNALPVSIITSAEGAEDCMVGHIYLITKTCLYNFDPLKPHFYIVKLGVYRGIHYFSYFCSKHRL